jgi:hypothetical protein
VQAGVEMGVGASGAAGTDPGVVSGAVDSGLYDLQDEIPDLL